MKLILFIFIVTAALINIKAQAANPSLMQKRLQTMQKFAKMYEAKQLNIKLFDIKSGYLQTSVGGNADKMPLLYFVTYSNIWWMPIIRKIEVPSIGYNPKTETGFIILNIYYDSKHIFRGMQYTKFNGDKISYIRTYASPKFFIVNENDSKVRLDGYGNVIWLTNGDNLKYSVHAAKLFFDSPVGKAFSRNTKTRAAVRKIKKNINIYLMLKKHE